LQIFLLFLLTAPGLTGLGVGGGNGDVGRGEALEGERIREALEHKTPRVDHGSPVRIRADLRRREWAYRLARDTQLPIPIGGHRGRARGRKVGRVRLDRVVFVVSLFFEVVNR